MPGTSPISHLLWTSSSENSRWPAAGGPVFQIFSVEERQALRPPASFAAPSIGLSCAHQGLSCAAGGWATGPRRALMVSTRVGMDCIGTTGAGHWAIAIPTSPGVGQGRRTRRGAAVRDSLGPQPDVHEGGQEDRGSWAWS